MTPKERGRLWILLRDIQAERTLLKAIWQHRKRMVTERDGRVFDLLRELRLGRNA